MNTTTRPATPPAANTPAQASDPELDPIGQNIESVLAFYLREEQNLTHSQRTLENISDSLGQPYFLGAIAGFVALWVLAVVWMDNLGFATFDPPPFIFLQGVIGLGAFMTMIVVLIRQNRMAKLEERRAHLELQVNLLTEQKTTKLINLIEELRRDLPMIKNRHDPVAMAFQQPTNPESVLAALDDRLETGGQAGETDENKAKGNA